MLLEPPAPRFEHEFLAHKTDFVITMEGGTLAWVDLWRGVMLRNVLDNDPVLHYIPFPKPMAGNMGRQVPNENSCSGSSGCHLQ